MTDAKLNDWVMPGERVFINSCDDWELIGITGTVIAREKGMLTVELDNDKTISIDENYVCRNIDRDL